MRRQRLDDRDQRLAATRRTLDGAGEPTLNGIDWLEVDPAQPTHLTVRCLRDPAGISAVNCRIDGGVRIPGPTVVSAVPNGRTLDVVVSGIGDFSTYEFVLLDPAAPDDAPPGFDPCLATIGFGFHPSCGTALDCVTASTCPEPVYPEPALDYLAKDFESFTQLMLDRIALTRPQVRTAGVASLEVTLVELLAHVADRLSYEQDALAFEAYLTTARRRTSVRRHARLLDYRADDGCAARTFVSIEVDPNTPLFILEQGTMIVAGGHGAPALTGLPDRSLGGAVVFETMRTIEVIAARSEIGIHDWDAETYCLPIGTTATALVGDGSLALRPGDLLGFEEICSPEGDPGDADRSHRHVVRLRSVETGKDPLTNTDLRFVSWADEDALPFELCVRSTTESGGLLTPVPVAVARGNVVPADHGRTVRDEPVVPAVFGERDRRVLLGGVGAAFAEPLARLDGSAAATLRQDPRRAVPSGLEVWEMETDPSGAGLRRIATSDPWVPVIDLIGADRFTREVVAELEDDGRLFLRFGDGQSGEPPEPGTWLAATYRIGGGKAGNVGPDALTTIVTDDAQVEQVTRVSNLVPAVGGTDPEPTEAIKRAAPIEFRTQERAVTLADVAAVCERHPQVQRAKASTRWTGSWYTTFVIVDRVGGRPVDEAFETELRAHLERFRMMGRDLEIVDKVDATLDLALHVCVEASARAAVVHADLIDALSNRRYGDRLGLFHPDRYSFGDGLALSAVVATVMEVPGVESVTVTRFQRYGRPAGDELRDGWIAVGETEVLRLDNDPNQPEFGRLELDVGGGR